MLRGKTAHESAVAIRKPAGAGNGYRLRDRRIGSVRIAPSLKGEVTEKDFIGFAVLSNSLFPLKGEVSNHKGIFDEK